MAPSFASRIVYLKSLIQTFPRSPLSGTAQLSDAWISILDRILDSQSVPSSSRESLESPTLNSLREANRQHRDILKLELFKDSVTRLKNGSAMQDYPLPKELLTPPNDEFYYTRARNAIFNAEKGIKRPWWKVFFNVKGTD
ncbi:hypothetical protein L204_106115 [Cryptococcus depauperatus]|nr:hypothetical protein L204_05244 [Cryptococcus depauperatus CBS 7855]